MSISVTKTTSPKAKPPENDLGFGKYFTDHMFLMDYHPDKGWVDGRVVPYAPLSLDPASMVLHYGQELFEGLKAYRGQDGQVRLFRAVENIKRMNRSCERLFVPTIDEDVYMEALQTLIRTDIDWVPQSADASLYIRPFVIATDPHLGVRASDTYQLIIILSPSGAYYKGGMAPTNIYVETEDVRAIRGGLGMAKVGANYAATIRAQEVAKQKGFSQVLWLDGFEHKAIEEIGTSNAFFVIDGIVITPKLSGSILPGITRSSCLTLLQHWGLAVEERTITIDEVVESAKSGKLTEAFASGTAAVISPVGKFHWNGDDIKMGTGGVGPIAQRLYDALTGIQWGTDADPFHWITQI